MYRPLPYCLTIKNSEIEGLGLFAKEDIPKGTDLGCSHTYDYNGDICRTPLGGFYNHSDEPNTERVELGGDDEPSESHLKTLRDIKIGEEITVNYTLYKIS